MTHQPLSVILLLAGPLTLLAAEPRSPAPVARLIDEHIQAGLAEAKVPAAALADDAEFLRRVYLDLIGVIPTAAQARAFLQNPEADKRRQLIDELLAQPAHAKHFARLWRDRLAHEENAGGARRDALEGWLAEQLNQNRAWSAIIADLIGAEGSTPATAYIFNNLDDGQPRLNKLAASTARLFLGTQLQCAECHDHPYTAWKQTDFWGLAAFYSRTLIEPNSKPAAVAEHTAGPPKTRFGPPPIRRGAEGAIVIPEDAGTGAGTTAAARFLGGEREALPDGPVRPLLARWLTGADNPYFARAAVNRLWAHCFARGFVNPIDDIHEGNPASHPQLLDALAAEFAASGFDQKHLLRCICNSQTYQRTSRGPAGRDGQEAADREHFGRLRPKVMNAEMLYDSLLASAGVSAITKGSMARREFVRFFLTRDEDGDPTEFSNGITQVLVMMNDKWFNTPPKTVEELVRRKVDAAAGIEEIYLATLSRLPTTAERQRLLDYVSKKSSLSQGLTGVWWILVNSEPFILVP